jgi:hypothetical protein
MQIIESLNKDISENEIINYLNIQIRKPTPILLSPPKKYKIIKTEKLVSNSETWEKVLITPMGLFFGLVSIMSFQKGNIGTALLFLFFFIFMIFFWAWKPRFIEVDNEVPLSESEYQILNNEYNKKKIDAEKQNIENDNKYRKELSDIGKMVKTERARVIKELHIQSLKSFISTSRAKENIIRGKSELDFLPFLIKKFGRNIHADLIPNKGYSPFRPDFVFVDDKTGLHIDIEIDEPYSLTEKLPIHYIGSNDDERNSYFLNLNWAVVRFTENQIKNFPEQCCDIIASVIESLLNKNKSILLTIPEENRWTYEEALLMQHNQTRNK